MALNLISLSTVKTELGIGDGSQDAALTARIPIVSNDIRRILQCEFSDYILADYVSGTAEIELNPPAGTTYNAGQVFAGVGIPDDTYLVDLDPLTGIWTLSASPTSSGTWVNPTVEIGQWGTISKMIWYKTQKLSTSGVDVKELKSISYGPVRKEYSESEIDKQYDYPIHLLNDLGPGFQKVG